MDLLAGMEQRPESLRVWVLTPTQAPGQNLAMPATDDDTLLPFSLPSICHKKVTAAFDGGSDQFRWRRASMLAGADKRLGLIEAMAAIIPDHCDPTKITQTMPDILRARIYRLRLFDADDLDDLRKDPAFKLACGRPPGKR